MLAVGVVVAANTHPGISYGGSLGTLFLAVLLLSLANVVIRPLLILFALPFVVMTFGLGLVLINALLFWLVAELVPGFEVSGFWPAVWGAVVVSITSLLANMFFGSSREGDGGSGGSGRFFRIHVDRRQSAGTHQRAREQRRRLRQDDDVIDV